MVRFPIFCARYWFSNEREKRNQLDGSISDVSEQPKVVTGVCIANSQDETERFHPRTQESIPLSLKQLRSFQRNRTAKAVLGPGLALGYDTFHSKKNIFSVEVLLEWEFFLAEWIVIILSWSLYMIIYPPITVTPVQDENFGGILPPIPV